MFRAATDAASTPALPASAPDAGRVAYLTNVYPKVSHSFIREEIQAMERAGLRILRLTVRKPSTPLLDAVERAEAKQTTALLDAGVATFARAVAARAIKQPSAFFTTLRLAVSMGRRGSAGIVRNLAYFVEACLLGEILERESVRHVHVHFGTNPASVALFAHRLGGPTYSLTVHGPDEFDAPGGLHLREKIAGASFAVAISHHGRGQLLRWSDIADWPKVAVVRCGVAPCFSHRSDVGLSSTTLTCVARLSAQKGIPILLEAAGILARTQSFQLRIIGDGEMRAEIEGEILARGLGDKVRLLGWQSTDSVRREIENGRALVVPSFAEGLPVVIMEAFAIGRPVVATAIAGIPELVDSGNGWLVPSGSAEALANAMREALAAPLDDLQEKATRGRKRVAEQHDIDANAAALRGLMQPLVYPG